MTDNEGRSLLQVRGSAREAMKPRMGQIRARETTSPAKKKGISIEATWTDSPFFLIRNIIFFSLRVRWVACNTFLIIQCRKQERVGKSPRAVVEGATR